jgi:hypothetical protein
MWGGALVPCIFAEFVCTARTYFSPSVGLKPVQEPYEVGLLAPAFYGNFVRDVATRKRFRLHLEINLGVNVGGIKRDVLGGIRECQHHSFLS